MDRRAPKGTDCGSEVLRDTKILRGYKVLVSTIPAEYTKPYYCTVL